jgi:hypothetical protein
LTGCFKGEQLLEVLLGCLAGKPEQAQQLFRDREAWSGDTDVKKSKGKRKKQERELSERAERSLESDGMSGEEKKLVGEARAIEPKSTKGIRSISLLIGITNRFLRRQSCLRRPFCPQQL